MKMATHREHVMGERVRVRDWSGSASSQGHQGLSTTSRSWGEVGKDSLSQREPAQSTPQFQILASGTVREGISVILRNLD